MREKDYVEALQGVGNVVGEYIGNGQGEVEDAAQTMNFDDIECDTYSGFDHRL